MQSNVNCVAVSTIPPGGVFIAPVLEESRLCIVATTMEVAYAVVPASDGFYRAQRA